VVGDFLFTWVFTQKGDVQDKQQKFHSSKGKVIVGEVKECTDLPQRLMSIYRRAMELSKGEFENKENEI
jgi:hypothetical protein